MFFKRSVLNFSKLIWPFKAHTLVSTPDFWFNIVWNWGNSQRSFSNFRTHPKLTPWMLGNIWVCFTSVQTEKGTCWEVLKMASFFDLWIIFYITFHGAFIKWITSILTDVLQHFKILSASQYLFDSVKLTLTLNIKFQHVSEKIIFQFSTSAQQP